MQWIDNRKDVTAGFKYELHRIYTEANKADPEAGLGFDAILDAQDAPEPLALYKTDSEYLIAISRERSSFKLTMKLKLEEGHWRVDGSGIIQIPKEKRIKR